MTTDKPEAAVSYERLRVDIADVIACFSHWQKEPSEMAMRHLESSLRDLMESWRSHETDRRAREIAHD